MRFCCGDQRGDRDSTDVDFGEHGEIAGQRYCRMGVKSYSIPANGDISTTIQFVRERRLMTDESAKYILQCVRDHSGTHATAPVSKNPAHRPHITDHRRPCETLVGVSQAEH